MSVPTSTSVEIIIQNLAFAFLRFGLVFGLLLVIAPSALGQDFITEWTFDAADTEIVFQAETAASVDYTWSASPSGNSGSGSFNQDVPDEVILSGLGIEAGDVVTVSMAPQSLEHFFMAFDSDSESLTNVVQWGAVEWISMHNAFWGCENLTISASDSPNLENVTDMSGMFNGASSFNNDINGWDVSNVENMGQMFSNADSFNRDLNGWDVSNATTLEGMFTRAYAFDGDITGWDVSSVVEMSDLFWEAESFNRAIGGWDVSNVVDMSSMFRDALVFNQDISGWDMSGVADMDMLFRGALSFNQNIGVWDVSSVVDMRYVFNNAVSFNQDIGDWDVSSVIDMEAMFKDADSFNQYIGGWDVSSVEDMQDMFGNNDAFNQAIGGWDVSAVEDMSDMFENATVFDQYIGDWDLSSVTTLEAMFHENPVFNQDISSWDVSNVVNMEAVFEEANAFNQDIGNWDVSNVEEMWDLFSEAVSFNQNLGNWVLHPEVNLTRALEFSGMDCDHYSATLIGWRENNPDVTDRSLGASEMEFGTAAAEARDSLIIAQGWTIEFDAPSGNACDGVLSATPLHRPDESGIVIYPNPTRHQVVVQGAPAGLGHISVINAQGRDVTAKSAIVQKSSDEITLDLSGFAPGFYIVKTASGTARVVKR